MTRDRQLDDVLREWVDLGEDRLPQHNLAAALAAVATSPQRSARAALLEGVLMRFRPFAVPLSIAAVLLVAFGAFALINRTPSVGPQPTQTPPDATQVEGALSTSRFAIPFRLTLDAAPEPEGWYVTETDSFVIIGPAASSDSQSQLVILDPTQARVVDDAGVASALPGDFVAWLDAQAGITAGPQVAFDTDEQESYPVAGQDVPVFSIEIDPEQSGSRVLVETDEGPVLSVPDSQASWWLLPLEREGRDLMIVLTSDAEGERSFGGSYLAMAATIELR